MDSLTGVFPRDELRPTESGAEKRVWRLLQTQLQEGWTAWHSMRTRPQFSIDTEADFVLASLGRDESNLPRTPSLLPARRPS